MDYLPFQISIASYKHVLRKTTDMRHKMIVYSALGDAYYSSHQLYEALDSYQHFKDIAVELGDRKHEALAYQDLSRTCFDLKDFKTAAAHVMHCLDIVDQLDNVEMISNSYGELGKSYGALGQHKEAIKCFESCLVLKSSLGDKRGQSLSFMNLGNSYQCLGKYQEALEHHQQHLDLARERKERNEETEALLSIGDCYKSLYNYDEAVRYHRAALDNALELRNNHDQAKAYRCLGYDYLELRQNNSALECFDESLHISKRAGFQCQEINIYQGMGHAYRLLRRNEEAIDCFQKCLSLARKKGDEDAVSRAYVNIAIIYEETKNYHEAHSCLKKALAAAVDEQQKQKVCANLGSILHLLGQYHDAVEYLEETLNHARENGDRDFEARTSLNLGSVYKAIGKYDKALQWFTKAQKIGCEINNQPLEATAYGGIGSCRINSGNYKEAIECYEKRLDISKKVGDRNGEAYAHGDIGNVYEILNNNSDAIKHLEKQLEIAKEIGNRNSEKNAKGNLVRVYVNIGEHDKAIEFGLESVAQIKEFGDTRGEAQIYTLLGQCYYRRSYRNKLDGDDASSVRNLKEAERCLRESLRCYDYMFEHLREKDEMKISILDTFIQSYKLLTEVCILMEQKEHALLVAEHGRARALEDLLQTKYAITTTGSSNTIIYSDIEKILSPSNCILFYVIEYGGLARIWAVKHKAATVFTQCMINSSELASLLELSEAEKQHLETINVFDKLVCDAFGTMLVRGIQCEDRSMESTAEVEENRCVYKEDDHDSLDVDHLEFLYAILVAPVEEELKQDEIVIIPDGALFKVPFAALRDPETKSYLSDSKRIRLSPSLTTLKILNESSEDYHSITGALIVGDPDVGEVMFRKKKCNIKRLPGAKREALRIGEILGVTAITGQYATKDVIKERLGEGVAVIHFAAHGSEEGEIALSPGVVKDAIPEEEKYLLTMTEVQEIGLKAQLVVLSCCHSGRGEIKSEGVVGMSRAFLAAGARAVVATLWAIDDNATMVFMTNFYSHLKSGESVSVSLHQAMNEMKGDGRYCEPRYWAPFFVLGNDVNVNL